MNFEEIIRLTTTGSIGGCVWIAVAGGDHRGGGRGDGQPTRGRWAGGAGDGWGGGRWYGVACATGDGASNPLVLLGV